MRIRISKKIFYLSVVFISLIGSISGYAQPPLGFYLCPDPAKISLSCAFVENTEMCDWIVNYPGWWGHVQPPRDASGAAPQLTFTFKGASWIQYTANPGPLGHIACTYVASDNEVVTLFPSDWGNILKPKAGQWEGSGTSLQCQAPDIHSCPFNLSQ